MIDRRKLLLASGALLAPAVGLVQPADKVYRLGVLGLDPRQEKDAQPLWAWAVAELAKRGYVEGRNLAIVARGAGMSGPDLDRAAAELVALKVDVILGVTNSAPYAAKRASTTIPIVAFNTSEPVRDGLIASLAHPAGNVTGCAAFYRELVVKRIQLIAETAGKPARIAHLGFYYPGLAAASAVSSLRAQFHVVMLKSIDQLEEAFEGMARQHVDALAIDNDAKFFVNAERIAALASHHRLPAIADGRQHANSGLLMSYGVDYVDLVRKAAAYIDRIFKGANPGDLPFERASRFEMIVNLKTAKALGLTIPQSILVRASEIIQ